MGVWRRHVHGQFSAASGHTADFVRILVMVIHTGRSSPSGCSTRHPRILDSHCSGHRIPLDARWELCWIPTTVFCTHSAKVERLMRFSSVTTGHIHHVRCTSEARENNLMDAGDGETHCGASERHELAILGLPEVQGRNLLRVVRVSVPRSTGEYCQTETSSPLVPNVSIAPMCSSSNISRVKEPADSAMLLSRCHKV